MATICWGCSANCLFAVFCFKWSVKKYYIAKTLQAIWEAFLYSTNLDAKLLKCKNKNQIFDKFWVLFVASCALLERHSKFNRFFIKKCFYVLYLFVLQLFMLQSYYIHVPNVQKYLWRRHTFWNLEIHQNHQNLNILRIKHFFSNKKISFVTIRSYNNVQKCFPEEVTFKNFCSQTQNLVKKILKYPINKILTLKTLHKKMNFPLRISCVNVTKSAVLCGFSHTYWKNL